MEFNTSYIGLRNDIISEITGTDKTVLDVGCATGVNGKYLLDKGFAKSVYGIEIDAEMASEAKQVYNSVLVGSLDDTNFLNELDKKTFDYILCGDVLEHLDNPWLILKNLVSCLKDDGKIIISMPNIQHIDVFIHIYLKNTWPVNKRGIFDKTHRRFFTFKDFEKLIKQAGLQILKIKRHFRFRDRIDSKFPIHGYLLKKIFPRLYTFQYIIVCSPKHNNDK